MSVEGTSSQRVGSDLPSRVTHTKTGNRYVAMGEVLDCTNSRDGTRVVLYQRADGTPERFVREAAEFAERFQPDRALDPIRLPAPPTPVPCRHLKTGNPYLFLGEVIDCTNSRDGTRAALYMPADDASQPTYVRELGEFWSKFEPAAGGAREG